MIDRNRVLRYRVHAQQLDRDSGTLDDTVILDFGVQDTGPDGARWALAARGVDVAAPMADELITLWTLRGAPHRYRRADAGQVAAAVAPYSDADAGSRIYDAAKPLRAAGIGIIEALDAIAATMRDTVTEPMVKGELSQRLNTVLPKPYLRDCTPCQATHLYEMPFRLSAVRAGLELRDGTSPPVLERIPGFTAAATPQRRFEVIRCYLRLLGPATHKQVAEYLDAPVADVTAHWPTDVVPVDVEGESRWLLAADEAALLAADGGAATRLLAPYDLFLQGRDRSTIVPDPGRAKRLWPRLGRPGAVLHDAELVGTWRPRKSGAKLAITVEPWRRLSATVRETITDQAERVAACRGARLSKVTFDEG